jgi:hypothetical protein
VLRGANEMEKQLEELVAQKKYLMSISKGTRRNRYSSQINTIENKIARLKSKMNSK